MLLLLVLGTRAHHPCCWRCRYRLVLHAAEMTLLCTVPCLLIAGTVTAAAT
jgi:hypothetical protein